MASEKQKLLIEKLKNLVANPGTPHEGQVAQRLLAKIQSGESEVKDFFDNRGRIPRCDACTCAYRTENREGVFIICNFHRPSEDVTGFAFDGKSPPSCPFKVAGLLMSGE